MGLSTSFLTGAQIKKHDNAVVTARIQQPLTFQWRDAPNDAAFKQPQEFFEKFCRTTANTLVAGAKSRYSLGYELESVRYLKEGMPVGYTPDEVLRRIRSIANSSILRNTGYKANVTLKINTGGHLALHMIINQRK